MGCLLSVRLANIHMIQTENDVVKPLKTLLYKRCADDRYGRHNNNCADQL